MGFSLRWYLALMAVTAAWFAVMSGYFDKLPNAQALDVQMTVSAVHHALSVWDEAARAYHSFGTRNFDMIFPVQLSVVLWLGIMRFNGWLGQWKTAFGALVAVYLGADYIENFASLNLLQGDVRGDVRGAGIKVAASWAKYASLLPVLCVVVFATIREAIRPT
ncbi:MAG: hypothetical protein ABJQ34_15740 [Paracoccaceae bacterium]